MHACLYVHMSHLCLTSGSMQNPSMIRLRGYLGFTGGEWWRRRNFYFPISKTTTSPGTITTLTLRKGQKEEDLIPKKKINFFWIFRANILFKFFTCKREWIWDHGKGILIISTRRNKSFLPIGHECRLTFSIYRCYIITYMCI